MPKLKKAITNQTKPDEIKEKVAAIDEPQVTPETTPELNLDEVRSKDPSELKDEEQELLEENSDQLTDEEKTRFSIEGAEIAPEVPEVEDKEEELSEPDEDTQDDTDWRARYRGSTQEAQVLASQNKNLVTAVDEAAKLAEPTDEDLIKEYGGEWEIMDNVQRKLAKDNFLNKRRFEMVDQAVQKTKKSEEWVGKVREFTDDAKTLEKFPGLKGKEVEFSQFCAIPSRVGVDFGDLVKAFLFDVPPVRPQRKNLFETKGGGQVTKPKGLTSEEVAFIRTNDQKKYKQLIKEGKIKFEI